MVLALQPKDVGLGRLFDQVRDAVVVTDGDDGALLLSNSAATALVGLAADEGRAQTIDILLAPESRERYQAALARCWESQPGANRGGQGPLALDVVRSSGERVAVELTLSLLPAQVSNQRLVLLIARDLTERWRAEEALARERVLRELTQRMDAFLGIASHELLTPVTVMRATIDMAERRLAALARELSPGAAKSDACFWFTLPLAASHA
jgi:PAS domain S-box-containing protein